MNIIIALLIFGIIVLIHEFGHFLLAKKNGIKVLEFSVGLGPRLYTYHGKETDYSLKLLPLGGSCMMQGEDDEEEKEGSFNAASVLGRISVIAAGPIFNFILAFFMALILVGMVGVDKPVITSVMDGYPAQAAGLKAGDTITKIDGTNITFYRQISMYLYMHAGESITIEATNSVEDKTLVITPIYSEEYGAYMIGISGGVNEKVAGIGEVLLYSIKEVGYNISSTISSLVYMIRGQISTEEISGPVGIVSMMGDTLKQSEAYGFRVIFLSIVNMILLLSANLGVMNLLPLPALDGGRLLFLFFELILRRPLNRKVEGYIHLTGFVLLMTFMIFIIFKDIARLL